MRQIMGLTAHARQCETDDPMKYFTLERYLALGNLEDERTFLAAHQEWEAAITGYRVHLDAIKKELPRKLRPILASVSLHDARVLSMYQDKWFVITLQPASDPERLVTLFYELVEEPEVKPDTLPAERCREPVEWLYDELDLDRPEAGPLKMESQLGQRNLAVAVAIQLSHRRRGVRVRPGEDEAVGAHLL